MRTPCPELLPHKENHRILIKELLEWRETTNSEKLIEPMVILKTWFPGRILMPTKNTLNTLTNKPQDCVSRRNYFNVSKIDSEIAANGDHLLLV